MKKTFEEPFIEIVGSSIEDVIATSTYNNDAKENFLDWDDTWLS